MYTLIYVEGRKKEKEREIEEEEEKKREIITILPISNSSFPVGS